MYNCFRNVSVSALIFLITNFIFLNNASSQTTYFSRATGNWNNNATWSLSSGGTAVGTGQYPVAGDIVFIERGFIVSIPTGISLSCGNLNLTSINPGNATLIFNAASSLSVSGNINVGTAGSAKQGLITMTLGGTINCQGNLTIGSDASSSITQGANSTVTVNGTAIVIQPGIASVNAWNVNAGTAAVNGLFTLAGTNTTTNRNSNLVITTGVFNANAGIQVEGTTAATKIINMTGASGILNIGGSGINGAAGSTFTRGSGTSAVNYFTTSLQTIGNYNYFNLTISGSGTKTLAGSTIVSGTLSVKAGIILSLSAFNLTSTATQLECGASVGSTITGTGNLILAGNLTVKDAVGPGTSAANISTPVSLNGNRTFTVEDDGSIATDLVISGIISGSNTLTKAGTGTLLLLASNTYTSTTIINAGIIQYGVNNALAAGAVTVNGGILDIQQFSDAVGIVNLTSGAIIGTTGILSGLSYTVSNGTISAILGGNGTLTKTTAGTVTLSAVNTYSGATTVSAGTLSINSMSNFGTGSAIGSGSTTPTITIDINATLIYAGSGHSSNRSINIAGNTAAIEASGTGLLNLTTGISSNNKNLILKGTGNAIISGAIATGNGTVTKDGSGTWKLGAANTYTGLTTVKNGILQYAVNNALATGAVSISGGILDMGIYSDAVGAITLTNGSITGTSAVLTGTSYTLQSGTVSAILAGTGAITKTTSGTVLLSAANTYTGRTTINAGILSVATIGDGGVAGNLGAATNAATNLVLGGGTLQYTGVNASTNRNFTLTAATTSAIDITSGILTMNGASTNTSGGFIKTGTGTLILSGNNLNTGSVNIATGTLKLAAAERINNAAALIVTGIFDMNGFSETVGSLAGAGTVNSSATGSIILTAGNANNTTFSGVIQNGSAVSIAFTKTGSGTLTLSGNNTYTGITSINAGTLLLGSSEVIPNNLVVLAGGILRTGTGNGFNETIGAINLSATSSISLGSGSHSLSIANSSAVSWIGAILNINGWTGSGGITGGGTAGKIMVGTGGLTAAQLTKITFTGFNNGAMITASGELVPAVTIYYSTGDVAPNTLTSWKSARNGTGTSPVNFSSGNIFIIQNTHAMTTTGAWSVSGTGSKVWIENGGTLTSNNPVTIVASGFFQIDDGGTYNHNNTATTASTIFAGTELFEPNSNVHINNWSGTSNSITNAVSLPFGNLKINWDAGGNWQQNLTGVVKITSGDFTIENLGNVSNEFILTPATNGIALTFTVGRNISVNQGILTLVGTGVSQSKSCTLHVMADMNIAGTIDMNSINATSGQIEMNIAGNFSVTGSGILRNSMGSGTRMVNFNNADSIQTFYSTANGINSSSINFNVGTSTSTNTLKLLSNFVMANGASLNVLNNATLDCATKVVQATVANNQGNFNLNSGATILIGSAAGISATGATGNIQTAASRIFNATANYIYKGLVMQVTGTGLTVAGNLEINNVAGVTLSVNTTVNENLLLTSGNVNCDTKILTVSNSDTAAITRINGHVIGYLQRAISTGANLYEFPVGSLNGYAPASINFSNVGVAGSIMVKSNEGPGINYPAALSSLKRLNRNWAISNNGISNFTADVNFSFLNTDLAGGVTPSELKAYCKEPVSAIVYTSSSDFEIVDNAYNYYNLVSFSSTEGYTEFGAGSCKEGFIPTFTKTMASACGGAVDGTITVTPFGGTAPFLYSWNGPDGYAASTPEIINLATGDYTVVVTEVSGCSFTIPDITIWQALLPVVTNSGSSSGSCSASGSIILYGSYGVAPFSFSIDGVNYQTSNTFSNLPAGNYTGYVKDVRGCVGTKPNLVVAAILPVTISPFIRGASSCANNGSIEVYISGGVSPYTYSINGVNYFSSNTFSNMAGGTYTVWVKDGKGCVFSKTNVVVTKAITVNVSSSKTNTSACANTGYIQVYGTGGVPPYTYSLNNISYQQSGAFTGLAVGTYNGWVMDSKGCKNVQWTINIGTDAASVINVTATTLNSGSCSNSGIIQLFSTGGTGPFTYSLDNITYQSSNTFNNKAAGTYTGWVKDVRGCKGSRSGIVINQSTAVTVTESHTNSSTCMNDGTIQLRPSGGEAPYSYSLDNINYQAGCHFTGLAPGVYNGWVKDFKGCKKNVQINISVNPLSVTNYASPADNCNSANGKIMLFPVGGFGPYTYSIDGVSFQNSNVFNGLTPATYDGFIKDSRNCIGAQLNINVGPFCQPNFAGTITSTASKIENSAQGLLDKSDFTMIAFPNPSASYFTLKLENNKDQLISIKVTDILGRLMYHSKSNEKQSFVFGGEFKPGAYFVQVIRDKEVKVIKLIKQ